MLKINVLLLMLILHTIQVNNCHNMYPNTQVLQVVWRCLDINIFLDQTYTHMYDVIYLSKTMRKFNIV